MDLLDAIFERAAGRVEGIVSSIDAGDDPAELIRRAGLVAPWELAAAGNAFVADAIGLEREQDAS